MKTSKISVTSGFLSILALLFLMPSSASAQRLDNGWYEVEAQELSVRNFVAKYVMGTLLSKNGMHRPDRFYIRLMNPGSKWAWGYAQGEDFNGCGWVYTFRNNRQRSLKRMTAQPSGSPSCSAYERRRPYRVRESVFALMFADGRYTNSTPPSDGSGANIRVQGGTMVFGNYVGGKARTALNRNTAGVPQPLTDGHRVCWRFFTKDGKFVMVNFKGICRDSGSKLSAGKWGFVRCSAVKPSPMPRDHVDSEKFKSLCDLRP